MQSKIYNPFSDTDRHKKNIEACITVIETLQEDNGTDEAIETAKGIWNTQLRNYCLPCRTDTFWQMALKHGLTDCRRGNDDKCPNYKDLLVMLLDEVTR